VSFLPNTHITAIRKIKKGFELSWESGESIQCSQLLVAAGGKAYPALGSKGELFSSLQQMGHTVLPLVPALGPVTADMHLYQRVQGQRLDAHVRLFAGEKLLGETTGTSSLPSGASMARP
jgi:predicted flavoprotein YhiN